MLIHIGYHKTGTTWLQNFLFNDAQAGFTQPWERGDIIDRLVLADSLAFDPRETRAYFDERLKAAESRGLIPVLSAERLSGNPHSGGYDSKLVADHLAATFPPPDHRVLIVFREQKSMILSSYKQYVRVGGTSSLRRYLNPPEMGKPRVPLFRLDYFRYDRLVAYYRNLYGPDRVLAMPFEHLKKDAALFTKRICDFAGAREPSEIKRERSNVALSGLAALLKRPVNALCVRDRVNPGALIDHPRLNTGMESLFETTDKATPKFVQDWFDTHAKRAIAAHVADHFREGNRRLGEMLGEDLGSLGYDV